MKRDPRTEIVSVRLTKAERAQLDAMGGPKALRRALDEAPAYPARVPWSSAWPASVTGVSNGTSWVVWSDGTVGNTWPATA